MASNNLQCPKCSLKARTLHQREPRTIVCERCNCRYLQHLQKGPRISLDSKDVSVDLNASFMCKNVKRTRRPFFRRRHHHHHQLPPLNVLGNIVESTEARLKNSTTIESIGLPKSSSQLVSGASLKPPCNDVMSIPKLPPIQPAAATPCGTDRARKIQDREHLCLPEINQACQQYFDCY